MFESRLPDLIFPLLLRKCHLSYRAFENNEVGLLLSEAGGCCPQFLKPQITRIIIIAVLVYVTAGDELICRPVTRDYMETELHRAMQRSFVHAVTMK